MRIEMYSDDLVADTFSVGVDPKKLTTPQKLSLLEAMGIPVDEFKVWIKGTGIISRSSSQVSLREFIERENK
jgi:hypothetical protein